MFIGHYGLALGLKRVEPKVSLGALFLAVQLVDLAWGATILLGWERVRIIPGFTPATPLEFLSYPITHSLVAAFAWAAAAAAIWYTVPSRDTSRRVRAAAVIELAVASHWFLDLVVHLPDLPLASDSSLKVGLGAWRSLSLTWTLELALLAAGTALYLRGGSRTHPVRRGRVIGFACVLALAYMGTTLGPPPPSVRAVGIGAIATILAAAVVGWWIDRAPILQKAS